MILGGIGQFFPSIHVQNVIVAVYVILFGLANGLLGMWLLPLLAQHWQLD